MTLSKRLSLIATVLAACVPGIGFAATSDDVTVISPPTSSQSATQKGNATDGGPVVHKSLHKKKETTSAPTPVTQPSPAATTVAASTPAPPVTAPAKPQPTPAPSKTSTWVTTSPTKPAPAATHPAPTVAAAPATNKPAASPAVETGLPVAKYPGVGAPIRGVSTYVPLPLNIPPSPGKQIGSTPHQTYYASTLPVSVVPLTSAAAGSFSAPPRTSSTPDFNFAPTTHKVRNIYPWRTNIVTTMFWIGEGSTPISNTTNVQSSWDEDWMYRNHGTDSPDNRNGYASGSHASTVNPFYVALPFNDLAFPDKARRWLPGGWNRRPVDGRPVSACKDRWVQIKNAKGDICYAQWEDVGPLRYDHAEYVFGSERPIGLGDNHAGLDVSPAVAEYLNINDRNRYTSWRFVDDEDVRPGAWLKLDEQAVLYTALQQLKNSKPNVPIQRTSEPIDDTPNASTAKKKVDASKG